MDLGRSENCSLVSITYKPPTEKMLSALPIKYMVGYPYFSGSQQHWHPFQSSEKKHKASSASSIIVNCSSRGGCQVIIENPSLFMCRQRYSSTEWTNHLCRIRSSCCMSRGIPGFLQFWGCYDIPPLCISSPDDLSTVLVRGFIPLRSCHIVENFIKE